jgi:ribosomal protein S18 acetylase RimI-like enzyme
MEAINLLTQKGVKIIELWAGEKNFHAQDFYKSQGFLEMERRGRWIRFIKDLEEQERA